MKEVEILLALRDNHYVTARQLAAQLQLSEKTIRNIIQSLRREMEEYGAHIHSKTKLGYELEIIDEEKFLSFIREIQEKENVQSTEERVLFILRTFLEHSNEYVKLDELSEMMHVSKSCINRDIREVKQLLEANHLKLEARPYYGMKIVGEEHALRACIVQYQVHRGRGTDKLVEFHPAVFQKILECTKQVLKKYDFRINEFQFQNLVMHLFVALIRIEKGNYISAEYAQYEELTGLKEYQIAQDLRESIQEGLQLEIPEQETFYITIHLATKKKIADTQAKQESVIVSDQVQQVVDRIIDHVDQTYSLNLKEDIDLAMSLYFHFVTLLKHEYQKKFRSYVENIYTADPSELYYFDFDKVDYIFSTIQTDIPVAKPVVLINPILGRSDIENVTQIMMKESKVRSFFKKELFFDHIQGETAEAALEEMVERIKEVEALPENFMALILEREKLGVTSFAAGVAFPHPSRPCTIRTFVAVGILDKKIMWKSNRVRMIYLFALTKEKQKEGQLPALYQLTGELLSDEDRIQDIVEKRTYENFVRHILEIEKAGE